MQQRPARRRRPCATAVSVLALCCLAFTLTWATQARPLNLEEMTQRAERVFLGRCIQVRAAIDPELGQVVTYATFVAQRSAKGGVQGQVTIRLLGDQTADAAPGRGMAGVPTFTKGEEVVLFLYKESRRGFTSPVGLGHGKFVVRQDRKGQRLALNAMGNESLFRNLSADARGRMGTSAHQPSAGGLDPDALLDMVQRLGAVARPSANP